VITRRGVGLLITAIIGFFVASATRVGWLHLADAVLFGALAVSAVLPHASVSRLGASARFTPRRRAGSEIAPVVGDSAELEVTLNNRARVPRLFVSASVPAANPGPGRGPGSVSGSGSGSSLGFGSGAGSNSGASRFFVAHIPSRGSSTVSEGVVCRRRGWVSLDRIAVECRAPFGLFRARRRPTVDARMLVYPTWFPMRRLKLIDSLGGEHSGRRPARRGDEVAGSRRYVAGDAMRDMHWKNTARTGRPTVKEFDAGLEESLAICFETGASLGTEPETTLEYSITIAASVGRVVLARGGEVRMANGSPGREVYFDWAEMMKRLAVLQPGPASAMVEALKNAEAGSRVLAIVAAEHHANVTAAVNAARRGVSVAAVVLEGFGGVPGAGGTATTDGAVRTLSSAGVPAVVCPRGRIAQGMDAIERGVLASRASTATSPSGRREAVELAA
jgi:uncharacterized protein (DUF58 family)